MYKINMIHSRTPPKTQALVAVSSIRSEGKGELRKEGLVENLFRKHLDSQISSSFHCPWCPQVQRLSGINKVSVEGNVPYENRA